MGEKLGKWILIFTLLILLTGCWNRRELNELSIAVALGLDEAEDGQIVVSVQLVNPTEIATTDSGGSGRSPVTTYRIQGRSIFESIRELTLEVNRKVYFSHLRMVVIGEQLSKKGVIDLLDFLSRDHEFRTDYFIVIAKDERAENILNVLTPQEKIPASKLYESLEKAEESWASTSRVTLDMLIDDLSSEGKSPILTGVMIKGSNNKGKDLDNIKVSQVPTTLKYNGLAVFKRDKLVGWLNENESKGYNYTQGNVKSTVEKINCQNGDMDVEIISSRSKIKGALTQSGDPSIHIDIYAEGNIGDLSCNIDISDPSSIPKIETMTESKIKEMILDAVRESQTEYKTDIFGFGDVLRRGHPKKWKRWKQNWDSRYSDLSVDVNVDVKIQRIGTINQSVRSRLRK
ncbi:Ger(x)C family spore germination protein [Neobacillus sp. NPDC097160]|uniref:Ger(x)C family spore germination protein n=1 Tax=Neobacillus sp. NPDC097160 TaxID=3364298 RepID=UPI00380C3E8D